MEPDQPDVQGMPVRRSGKWYILGAVIVVIGIGVCLYYYKGGFGNIGTFGKPQTVTGTANFIFSNPVTVNDRVVTGLVSVYLASSTEISLPVPTPKGAAYLLGGMSSQDEAIYALVYQVGAAVKGVPQTMIVRTSGQNMKQSVVAQSSADAFLVSPVLNSDGSLLAYGSVVPNGVAKTVLVSANGTSREISGAVPVAFSPDSTVLLMHTQNGLSIHPLNGGADTQVALPSGILLGKDVRIASVSPDSSRLTIQSSSGISVLSIDWNAGTVAEVYSVTTADSQATGFDVQNELLVASKNGTVTSYDATGKKTGTSVIQVPTQFTILNWSNPVSTKKS